jgi:hypothetical protein
LNVRGLFGCLAVLLGAVSIALTARYGYKGADTVVDGVISAVVFGAIALCACLFDAAAVRLWFMQHRAGSVAIGVIAATALVVTFTNSLGAIAARSDSTLAERANTKDAAATDRAELKRIMAERAALAALTPATVADVTAAQDAVAAAERIRAAECGNGDAKQRGPNCRARESEEQTKRTALAAAVASKTATDKAAKLEAQAEAIRARLDKAPPVSNANPLGAALEQIVGGAAVFLTAWQQAVVAAVFELCLVGVMVIYELLGQRKLPIEAATGARRSESTKVETHQPEDVAPPPTLSRRKAGTKGRKPSDAGSVKSFIHDHVFPADGERLDIKALMGSYRAWCEEKSVAPVSLEAFLDEVEKLFGKLGITIEAGDDQRVYCLGVTLKAAETSGQVSVH